MRIKNLILAMVTGLAFAGCSSDENLAPGQNGAPQYLTVSVNATRNLPSAKSLSRADLQGEYEEGTELENTVKSVRFYFFDTDGNAAQVKGAAGGTYYDVNMSGDKQDMDNVEKILTATLVIQTPESDKIPASIIAVVNPPASLKKVDVTKIEDLNNVVENHLDNESFIMSNSVYANGETKMEAVNVAGHLYLTSDEAIADPVTIYVERVLAKARLTVGLDGGENGIYKTSSNGAETYDDKEIYVKFLGWNVTATAETSRLMKEINPNWNLNLFGESLLWNTADYHRSFWAVNPTTMSYKYGPFNTESDPTAANALTSFAAGEKTPNYTYLQENASNDYTGGANPTTPSQVIIAAQLVDKDGKPMEFAEHAGIRTTVDGLVTKYTSLAGLWTDTDNGGKREITESDIELKTATDANIANQTTPGRYKVYAQLTEDAAKLKWYASNAEGAKTIDANLKLKNLGGAKVWKDGYTYYFFNIRHLNGTAEDDNTVGKYGVVRNHIYAANINSLQGLGTPVFKPGEIIYPEYPEDDDTFIAAEIRILSWRLVNQNIDLKW